MELKVWVEGIQRIVCGVTERTTCQDVVYALAHATGKTGRFTLIERWRNNERLLAPQEHPLKVLLKWGEYSNDVHFILQRSPLDKSPSPHPGRPASQAFKSTTPTTPTPTANNELPETPTPTHESPVSPTGSNPSPPSRELKKSLTFSGGHPSGELAPRRMGVVKGVPQNTNMPDVLNTSVDSIQSTNSAARLRLSNQSPRPTELRIPVAAAAGGGSTGYVQPPPYRDPPLPNSRGASPAGTNNAIVATSRSSNRELPQPPPYRDPPRPRGQSPLANGAVKPGVKWGGNEERIDLNSSWASRSSWESPLRSVDEEVDLLSHNSQRRSTSPVKRNLLQEFQATEASTDGDRDNNNSNPTVPSGAKRLLPATPTGAPPRPPSPTHDPQLGALIQLLNRQREKLEAQHAENGQYDADIEKYEQKAREREAVLEAMVQESTRLEELSQQAEEQIAVLEGTEMEMESVQAQESYLRSEIQTCQNKVSDYDRELQALRDQMRSLISDIRAEEKTMKDAEQQQSRELEEEFDRLNADLNTARVQSELCAQVEQQMDKEITSLEHTLADKKADLDRLIADIKQANLQSLSIAPVEESRHTVEGVGLISGGSGRRIIGSPRQLESAVPTNKNPHGVWV